MDRQEILKKVDHTLLAQTATWEEIKEICDDAIKYKTASVCIPPSYVRQAKAYIQRETQHIKEWMRHLTEMKVCQ